MTQLKRGRTIEFIWNTVGDTFHQIRHLRGNRIAPISGLSETSPEEHRLNMIEFECLIL